VGESSGALDISSPYRKPIFREFICRRRHVVLLQTFSPVLFLIYGLVNAVKMLEGYLFGTISLHK